MNNLNEQNNNLSLSNKTVAPTDVTCFKCKHLMRSLTHKFVS